MQNPKEKKKTKTNLINLANCPKGRKSPWLLPKATNCATNLKIIIIIISWKCCKLQELVQTQERKSSLKCDKIMQESCTLLTTLLPLFSFSFFFSHVGPLSCFRKTRRFLVNEFRKWGEICDLPAKCVFGKKSVGQWKMHTCGIPRHPPHHPSFFIALKTIEDSPLKRN